MGSGAPFTNYSACAATIGYTNNVGQRPRIETDSLIAGVHPFQSFYEAADSSELVAYLRTAPSTTASAFVVYTEQEGHEFDFDALEHAAIASGRLPRAAFDQMNASRNRRQLRYEEQDANFLERYQEDERRRLAHWNECPGTPGPGNRCCNKGGNVAGYCTDSCKGVDSADFFGDFPFPCSLTVSAPHGCAIAVQCSGLPVAKIAIFKFTFGGALALDCKDDFSACAVVGCILVQLTIDVPMVPDIDIAELKFCIVNYPAPSCEGYKATEQIVTVELSFEAPLGVAGVAGTLWIYSVKTSRPGGYRAPSVLGNLKSSRFTVLGWRGFNPNGCPGSKYKEGGKSALQGIGKDIRISARIWVCFFGCWDVKNGYIL